MCKRRILYIEDEPAILRSVQMLLELRLPVVVDPCMSAGGAELLLNRYCYDLVICDIGLPVVDGIQIIEKVLQRDPGQPVMLFSEYDSDETRAQAARIGVPVTPKFSVTPVDEFTRLVSELLEKRPCPEDNHRVRAGADVQPLQPITFINPNASAARMAVQLMGCTIAGACKLHKECLERARSFGMPAALTAKVASATRATRLVTLFLLIFPWFIA